MRAPGAGCGAAPAFFGMSSGYPDAVPGRRWWCSTSTTPCTTAIPAATCSRLIERAWWRRACLRCWPRRSRGRWSRSCPPAAPASPGVRVGSAAWGCTAAATWRRLIDRYVQQHTDAIRARLLPIALDALHRHREAGDRVVVATGAPPALARAILAFAPTRTSRSSDLGRPRLVASAVRHCHHAMKMTMLREAGFTEPVEWAYWTAAPTCLLQAARPVVVVNPKAGRVAMFPARVAGRHADPQLGLPGARRRFGRGARRR